jgi:Ca2+ transporting ATPase
MCVEKVCAIKSIQGDDWAHEYTVEGSSFEPIWQRQILRSRTHEVGAEVLSTTEGSNSVPNLIARIFYLCNTSRIELNKQGEWQKKSESTEAALLVLAEKIPVNGQKKAKGEKRTIHRAFFYNESAANGEKRALAFDRVRKSMSVFVGIELFVEGAPDGVIDRCFKVLVGGQEQALDAAMKRKILQFISVAYQKNALCVLALAHKKRVDPATVAADDNPESIKRFESGMTLVALVAMKDPPHHEVKVAIATCAKAGIKVVVITGDKPATAVAICKAIGIFNDHDHVTQSLKTCAAVHRRRARRVPRWQGTGPELNELREKAYHLDLNGEHTKSKDGKTQRKVKSKADVCEQAPGGGGGVG